MLWLGIVNFWKVPPEKKKSALIDLKIERVFMKALS